MALLDQVGKAAQALSYVGRDADSAMISRSSSSELDIETAHRPKRRIAFKAREDGGLDS